MGFRCGIVGLPNAGKSALFNALTQTATAQAASYAFSTVEPNVGDVAVPDDAVLPVTKFERKFRKQDVPIYRLTLRKTSPVR